MWENNVQATDDNTAQALCVLTDTHSEYVLLIAFPLQEWLHEHVPMLRFKYIGWIFFSASVYPWGRHVSAMQSLAKRFLAVVRVFQASWVIYKTWQMRQCFDWQQSYETICILSFMVCSMQGDQLSTVLVLLYATSQQQPPPPSSCRWWCRQPTGRQDKLLCGAPVSMRSNVILTDTCPVPAATLCLYMTVPHQDTNRFPTRCQIYLMFLANKEWNASTRTPWRASYVSTLYSLLVTSRTTSCNNKKFHIMNTAYLHVCVL